MPEDHLGDGPRKVDARHDFMADARMAAHQFELRWEQAAGPSEDLCRDTDFAQVVDLCGEANALDVVVTQAKAARDGGGDVSHPRLMARGVWILGLHRRRHCSHRSASELFASLVRLPEFGDVDDHNSDSDDFA